MTRYLTTAALILALATPTFAGGPIVTEEPPIADVRPQGDGGNWVVPVIIGLGVACLILCGGSDDAPPVVVPGPVCNTGC